MKKYKDFSNSSLNSEEEKSYLEKLFHNYYSKEHKNKYAAILKDKYQVERIENNYAPTKTLKTIQLTKYVIGIAASFLLIFLAWQFIDVKGGNLELLVSKYSSADILMNREIKRGEAINNEFRTAAIEFYNKGKYQDALNSYSLVDDVNEEDKFWMAMATFYEKEYLTAENKFNDLLLVEDLKFRNEIKWYYVLSLLQNGKKSEAEVFLLEMRPWQFNGAQELINELQKISENE